MERIIETAKYLNTETNNVVVPNNIARGNKYKEKAERF